MLGHGTSALLAAILVGSFLVRSELSEVQTSDITKYKFLVNFQQVMFGRNVDGMQTCKSVTNQ